MRPVKIQEAKKAPASQWVNLLLTCGIIASLLYIAMNIIVPMFYPGYNPVSQVEGELSAIGVKTRTIWMVQAFYVPCLWCIWMGIRLSAGKSQNLHILSTLMIINGLPDGTRMQDNPNQYLYL